MPLQPLKFAAFALPFLAHFLWVFLSMWRDKAEFCWLGLGGCLCVQVVGNDQRTNGGPIEKRDLVERKNSACSINKFQNKLSLLI